jgi:hypothetical protein
MLLRADVVFGNYEILLKSRRFTPKPGISADTKAAIEAIPGKAHVLIQLYQTPTIEERSKLERQGVKLLSYIPNNAWFASIPSGKADEIATLSNVRAISKIEPEDKISTTPAVLLRSVVLRRRGGVSSTRQTIIQ